MNDTGYLIWFIATIIMTVTVMALGVAASARSVSSSTPRVHSEGRHLHLVPHFRHHHVDRHHAA